MLGFGLAFCLLMVTLKNGAGVKIVKGNFGSQVGCNKPSTCMPMIVKSMIAVSDRVGAKRSWLLV